MSGPRIVASDDKFRLVRVEQGEKVFYVLETPDVPDALGCERWRECTMENNKAARLLRDWIIRLVLKGEPDGDAS